MFRNCYEIVVGWTATPYCFFETAALHLTINTAFVGC